MQPTSRSQLSQAVWSARDKRVSSNNQHAPAWPTSHHHHHQYHHHIAIQSNLLGSPSPFYSSCSTRDMKLLRKRERKTKERARERKQMFTAVALALQLSTQLASSSSQVVEVEEEVVVVVERGRPTITIRRYVEKTFYIWRSKVTATNHKSSHLVGQSSWSRAVWISQFD